jgi:hypothetical protein
VAKRVPIINVRHGPVKYALPRNSVRNVCAARKRIASYPTIRASTSCTFGGFTVAVDDAQLNDVCSGGLEKFSQRWPAQPHFLVDHTNFRTRSANDILRSRIFAVCNFERGGISTERPPLSVPTPTSSPHNSPPRSTPAPTSPRAQSPHHALPSPAFTIPTHVTLHAPLGILQLAATIRARAHEHFTTTALELQVLRVLTTARRLRLRTRHHRLRRHE